MIRKILPMKINKIPAGKENLLSSLCESGDYFGEIKKDGYWYEFENSDEGSFLFSSTTSAITGELVEKSANVPHLINTLKILPFDTIIIGEIYYPAGTSKDVTPIMGSLPEKAIERQKSGYGLLHYYIHDIIYYNGVDLTSYGASIRYKILSRVVEKYNLLQNECIEFATRVDDNLLDAIQTALDAGEEGMVLKKKTCVYHIGKRSPVWETIKVKKTDTCDAVIMGFCEPTKEYTGKEIETWQYWLNELSGSKVIGNYYTKLGYIPITKAYYYNWKTSMRVGAYDENNNLIEIGTISSGLTEEMQSNFSIEPDKYIGRVVELDGMMKNYEDHTLRHFFFKRFREDKIKEECTIKDIF